jgi:hypothetical protein
MPPPALGLALLLVLWLWPGWVLAQPAGPSSDRPQEPWQQRLPEWARDIRPFAYVESSYVFNATGAGRGGTNELRLYDYDEGFTFNAASFSLKRDPSEPHPFGFGVTLTAGLDSQKNHSLGMFRSREDQFPFRNTSKFDVLEAYVSARVPLGNGLTVSGGKFVSLLGYENPEGPLNLNESRGYLYTFAGPTTVTGGFVSYTFLGWLTVGVGVVTGSDTTVDNNSTPSVTGELAVELPNGFSGTLGWLMGPEQDKQDTHMRYVLDLVLSYTGLNRTTLAFEATYGHEDHEAFSTSLGTRQNTNAAWWGWALYGAYDWSPKIRTALRQEYFQDTDGARTGFGSMLRLWSTTLTADYRLWKGLEVRLEYRHDSADEKVFKARMSRPDQSLGVTPQSKTLDTFSITLTYLFF